MISDRHEICAKFKTNPKIRAGKLVQPVQKTIKPICRYFGAPTRNNIAQKSVKCNILIH